MKLSETTGFGGGFNKDIGSFVFPFFWFWVGFFCLLLDFMSVFFFFLSSLFFWAGMRPFVARGALAARVNERRNGKDGRTTSPGGQVDPTHTLSHTRNLTPHTRSLPLVV